MNGFDVILEKVGVLGFLALIGFLAYRLRWLGPEVKQGLQKLVFNITLPLMIFTTISRFEFTDELVGSGLVVFILTYFFLGFQYFLGWVSVKLLKIPSKRRNVHILHTAFGNVVFLGYPLIDTLFPGTPALFYAVIYHLAQMTIIWTLGIYQLSGDQGKGLFGNLKKLINPNTIAFAIGMLFMVFKISLPNTVDQTFRGLAGSNLYISLIYIGMLMADFKVKKGFYGGEAFTIVLNKLVIAPLAVLFLLYVLVFDLGFYLPLPAIGAMVMQTAMPCMAIMVILARNYGADENSAMVNVFLTTLMSLITLPAIFWLLQCLWI
nr:AEC family transporter [Bacteroidota bacterium]